MRRSIHTTTIALTTAAVLAGAPAAMARPATDPVGSAPAVTAGHFGPDLNAGQLRALAGTPVVNHFGPRPVAPVPDTGGGGSDVPWAFIALPIGLLAATGAARKASHRTVLPHRAPRVTI